jgi:hypothetical protein
MASLGEHFPDHLKRSAIESALKPGCVVRLEVKLSSVTKPKFLVIVDTHDPEYLSFLINSEINPFITNRPGLLQCQVAIDAKSHDFLAHDSHIACHEVFTLKRDDVTRSLMADPSAIKGEISLAIRAQIKAAVNIAKTLDKDKKKRIISSLENSA